MNKLLNISLVCLLLILPACNKKDKQEVPSYNKGSVTIVTDESFQSVIEALTQGYSIAYSEAKFNVQTQKEDLGYLALLENKAQIAVLSRELTNTEKAAYEKATDLPYNPAKFAADAVVFVVSKDDPRDNISTEELQAELDSEERNIIFDGTNSSNLNFVAQKFQKLPKELKFSIISGNSNIINELQKIPGKIGVIGLNTISRPYSKSAENLRNLVKILPVKEKGIDYQPSLQNIREQKYPFTRILYFLTNEGNFNIANGFIRYSCTHLGQIIVKKEGLQPYNLYPREVQMR